MFSIFDRIYDRFFDFRSFFRFSDRFHDRFSVFDRFFRFFRFFRGMFSPRAYSRARFGSTRLGPQREPLELSGSLDQVRAQVLSKGEYKVLDLLYLSIYVSIYLLKIRPSRCNTCCIRIHALAFFSSLFESVFSFFRFFVFSFFEFCLSCFRLCVSLFSFFVFFVFHFSSYSFLFSSFFFRCWGFSYCV